MTTSFNMDTSPRKSIELKPIGGRVQPLVEGHALKTSVGSLNSRCASFSQFVRRGASHASSSALRIVKVEEPEEEESRKPRRLMFAPVADVKVIEEGSFHGSTHEDEQAAPSKTMALFEEEEDDGDMDLDERIEKTVATSWLKRFLHRIPLMTKALLLVLLPVLALFVMSTIDLAESVDMVQETQKVLEFTDVVHSTQALSKSYLISAIWAMVAAHTKWDSTINTYVGTYNDSMEHYAALQRVVEGTNLPSIYEQESWKEAMKGMETHILIKRRIEAKTLSLEEATNYYVDTMTNLVSALAGGGSLTTDSDLRTAILATTSHAMVFLHWGIQTQTVTLSTFFGSFGSESFYRLYIRAVTLEQRYTATMLNMHEFEIIRDHYEDNITKDFMQPFLDVQNDRLVAYFDPSVSFFVVLNSMFGLVDRLSEEVSMLATYTTNLSSDKNNEAKDNVTMISVGLVLLIAISCFLVLLFVNSVKAMNNILQKEVDTRVETEHAVWRFFPQEFISYLNAADVFSLRPGDRTRLPMTVVFAQLLNFKDVSSDGTAEQTYDWLTDFVKEMIPIVSLHNGFVDKTTGDGIMALFSTPEGAVHAALQMQAKVASMNAFAALNDDSPWELGIGIHSGEVMLGLIGTRKRLEGTIISDTVNTASRVQGMCKYYGARILVTEEVASVVDVESFGVRCVGEVKMKGKFSALRLHDVFLTDNPLVREHKLKMQDDFEEALELYQDGKFQECMSVVDHATEKHVTKITDEGMHRRRQFAAEMSEQDRLPEGWDGEDIFSTK